jgi:hypothetical protein
MDSAILTTEVALEVIGVIGIAIIAGMAIYELSNLSSNLGGEGPV